MFHDLRQFMSDEDVERIDALGVLDDEQEFTELALLTLNEAFAPEGGFNAERLEAETFADFLYAPTPKAEGRLAKRLRLRAAQKWER